MDRYLGITNIKMFYVPFKSRSLEKLARAGAQPETSQNISLHNQNSRSLCSHFCDYSEIDLRLIICNICNINYIQRTNSKVLRVHNIVSYSPRGRKDDEGREWLFSPRGFSLPLVSILDQIYITNLASILSTPI